MEYAIYKLASESHHSYPIRKGEYMWTSKGRIILDEGLIRRFLKLLERKFQSERLYEFRQGLKRNDGLSMRQEITIAKIEVNSLAEYCKTIGCVQNRVLINSSDYVARIKRTKSEITNPDKLSEPSCHAQLGSLSSRFPHSRLFYNAD